MRHLSNKEKKQINEILWPGYSLDKKDEITEEKNILYKNGDKYLIILEKDKKKITKIIPHLRELNEKPFKSVYIDEGAIPFLIKGADMMRPGIHQIDEDIEKGEIILIKDLEHRKALAVGEAVLPSEEMHTQEKGVSVKVLHYMGDNNF
jgi:predicted RNA-binding protein (TIGR00451 family)